MTNQGIGTRIDAFISYKRSLGYVYNTQERYLKHYQKHTEKNFSHLEFPDKDSIDSFLDKFQGQTGGLYNAMAPLREFSRYLLQIGCREAYLIPPKQMPKLHPEPPYFFSEEEISIFFQECDAYFEKNTVPLARSLVLPAEFRLLYCCGLRPKEARILPAKDVHLFEKYIDVTQSKGPKNRRIYISDELAAYLDAYDRTISGIFPDRLYFFSKNRENPYSEQFIHYNFTLVWRHAFPDWSETVPKLYSFRHHFAWANINQWVREGHDVNAMLPYLMQYMGHNCIKHTLYYFRFVPDFYSDYKELSSRLNDRLPEVSHE